MSVSGEPTRRLFFAFWPSEVVRGSIAAATRDAVQACGGRAIPAHNLHATLLFLGSIAEARIPELAQIAACVAARGARDQLVLDRIEFWEKPRVLVATSAGTDAGHVVAGALVEDLRAELERASFSPDSKRFRAHVTVARKVASLSHSLPMTEVRWPYESCALVESRTLPDGQLYSVINSWPLDMRQNSGNNIKTRV